MRRSLHPNAPAYAALVCCAGAAVLMTQAPASLAFVLAWLLLGVTAGYSISGSP